ncbi:MAG: NAD(P)H-dependent oxidoreductase [Thermodesulfobacteriota bacterium]|nr:NAD(P)H-dependent oxidoreductase [Thermodesulfobacteriota bacterium]
MFVLGLQGSPRKKGNTDALLASFLAEAERLGGNTENLYVPGRNIKPCIECGTCERDGFCPFEDDMPEIYAQLRRADIVVMATPIFFYGPTAQMKALIDRSQALWARRYIHSLMDPLSKWRKGFVLAVGATKGQNLFEGLNLTAKYFFDALGASFDALLGYRQIEGPGEINNHPTALTDAREKANTILLPLMSRKRILFLCMENACRSQMASAFAKHMAGDRIAADSAGSAPALKVNPVVMEVMAEKGIDMAFHRPKSIDAAIGRARPDLLVSMGCGDACPYLSGVPKEEWDIIDPSDKPIDFVRRIRDEIEEKVRKLVTSA